ncbi:hypothetical protein ACWDU0_32730 [Streptomyces cellulosae]
MAAAGMAQSSHGGGAHEGVPGGEQAVEDHVPFRVGEDGRAGVAPDLPVPVGGGEGGEVVDGEEAGLHDGGEGVEAETVGAIVVEVGEEPGLGVV